MEAAILKPREYYKEDRDLEHEGKNKKLSLTHDHRQGRFVSLLAFGKRLNNLEPLPDHSYTLRCSWNTKKCKRGSALKSSSILPLANKVIQKSQRNVQNILHSEAFSFNRNSDGSKNQKYLIESKPEVFPHDICLFHKSFCLPFPRCHFINLPANYLLSSSSYMKNIFTKYTSINKNPKRSWTSSCGESCLLSLKRLKKNDNQALDSFHYKIISTKFGTFIQKVSVQEKISELHLKSSSLKEPEKKLKKKKLVTKKVKKFNRKFEEKKMIKHLQSLLPAIYQFDSSSPARVLRYSAKYIKELEEELKEKCLQMSSEVYTSMESPFMFKVAPNFRITVSSASFSEQARKIFDDEKICGFNSPFQNLNFNPNVRNSAIQANAKLMSFEELSKSIIPKAFDTKIASYDPSLNLNKKPCDCCEELHHQPVFSRHSYIDDSLKETFDHISFIHGSNSIDLFDNISADVNMEKDYIYSDVNLNSSVVSTVDCESVLSSISCS